MKKRILSMLLVIAMVMSLLSVGVSAADPDPEPGSGNPVYLYLVNTADGSYLKIVNKTTDSAGVVQYDLSTESVKDVFAEAMSGQHYVLDPNWYDSIADAGSHKSTDSANIEDVDIDAYAYGCILDTYIEAVADSRVAVYSRTDSGDALYITAADAAMLKKTGKTIPDLNDDQIGDTDYVKIGTKSDSITAESDLINYTRITLNGNNKGASKTWSVVAPTSKVYDGTAKEITVVYHDKAAGTDVTLVKDTDYTIDYGTRGNVDVGTCYYQIKFCGAYTGSWDDGKFTITKAKCTPTVTLEGWTEGETANTPVTKAFDAEVTATYTYKAKDADDSTYSSDVPTTAGEYTVKAEVAATSNYKSGSATCDFTIAAAPVVKINLDKTNKGKSFEWSTYNPDSLVYDGEAKDIVVEYHPQADATATRTLVEGKDYEITYTDAEGGSDHTSAGVVTYTIHFIGDFSGDWAGGIAKSQAKKDNNFTITKADITPVVTLAGWTEGSTANTPVTKVNDTAVTASYTYKVQGADDSTYTADVPTEAGIYTVKAVVAATDNYNSGSATCDFTIAAEAINLDKSNKGKSKEWSTVVADPLTYDGTEKPITVVYHPTADPTVNITLVAGTDYDIIYTDANGGSDITSAGKVKYAITFKGAYTGSWDSSYTILQQEVSLSWDDEPSYTYDGESHSYAAPKVVDATGTEVAGVNVKYAEDADTLSATDAGDYTVTVEGLDNSNYKLADKAEKSKTWKIAQKEVTLTWDTENNTFTYTGDDYTYEPTLGGVLDGDEVTMVMDGATAASKGEHTTTVTDLSGADADNYKLPSEGVAGKWSIKAAESGITYYFFIYDGSQNADYYQTKSNADYFETIAAAKGSTIDPYSDEIVQKLLDDGLKAVLDGYGYVAYTTSDAYELTESAWLLYIDGKGGKALDNSVTVGDAMTVCVMVYPEGTQNAVAATCTKPGNPAYVWYTDITATTHYIYEDEDGKDVDAEEAPVTDALGHDFANGEVTTYPTIDTKGVYTWTCSRCTETKHADIDPLKVSLVDTATGELYPVILWKDTVGTTEMHKTYTGSEIIVDTMKGTKNNMDGMVITYTLPDEDKTVVTLGRGKSKDYSITGYTDNIKAGTAYVNLTINSNKYRNDGSANYQVTFEIDGQTVAPVVTITGWTYGEYDETVNVPSVTGIPAADKGAVTYEYKAKDAEDSAYSETVPTDAGDYVVKAVVAADGSYKAAESEPVDFTIAKKEVTLSWPTGTSFNCDGKEHSFKPTIVAAADPAVKEFAAGEGLVYSVNSETTETEVGSYYTIVNGLDKATAANYELVSTAKTQMQWKIVSSMTTVNVVVYVDNTTNDPVYEGTISVPITEDYKLPVIAEKINAEFAGTDITADDFVIDSWYIDNPNIGSWSAYCADTTKGTKVTAIQKEQLAVYSGKGSSLTVCAIVYGKDTVFEKAATCTETGVKAYTYYTDLNGIKRDPATKAVINDAYMKNLEIPALGHKMTVHEKVDPTCEDKGTEAYYTCSNDCCKGKLFSDAKGTTEISAPVEIPATGHEWDLDNYDVTAAPSLDHEGTLTFTCKNDASHTMTVTTSKLTLAFALDGVDAVMAGQTGNTPLIKTYTGSAIEPTVTGTASYTYTDPNDSTKTVTVSDELVKDTNFKITGYEKNTEAGADNAAVVKLNYLLDAYTIPVTLTFTIHPKDAVNAEIDAIGDQTYTGSAIEPAVTVKDKTTGDVIPDGYTVSYDKNTDAGEATVTVTFTDGTNYTGSTSATFQIVPCDLTENFEAEASALIYNGNIQTPTFTVTDKVNKLTLDSDDYTVALPADEASLALRSNAGTYTAAITFKGNYTGKGTVTYTVDKCDAGEAPASLLELVLDQTSFTYDGKTHEVVIQGYDNGDVAKTQFLETSATKAYFSITDYSDNVNEGTCTVTVTFKDKCRNFKNSTTCTFTIAPATAEKDVNVSIADIAAQTYTGSEITPDVTLTDKLTGKTIDPADYTVTYADNTKAGTAKVTVTFNKGANYEGTVETTFTINKALVTVELADDVDLTYGEAFPTEWTADQFTFTGFLNSDTARSVLTSTDADIVVTSDYSAGDDVGAYSITGISGFAAANYTFTASVDQPDVNVYVKKIYISYDRISTSKCTATLYSTWVAEGSSENVTTELVDDDVLKYTITNVSTKKTMRTGTMIAKGDGVYTCGYSVLKRGYYLFTVSLSSNYDVTVVVDANFTIG